MFLYGSTTRWNEEPQQDCGGGHVLMMTTSAAALPEQQPPSEDGSLLSSSASGSSSFDNNSDRQDSSPSPKRSNANHPIPAWYMPLIPEHNPVLWIWINVWLLLSGCLLVADCWYADKYGTPLQARPFAQAYCLVWEFCVCLFWTLESGGSAAFCHYVSKQPLAWYVPMELVMAVLFTAETAMMLWQWDLRAYELTNVRKMAVYTSFYLYMVPKSLMREKVHIVMPAHAERRLHVAISLPILEREYSDGNEEEEEKISSSNEGTTSV